MRPSIGRTVIVRSAAVESNGMKIAAAVITRVWRDSDTRNEPAFVNTMAFPDFGQPTVVGSVDLYDTEVEATAAKGDGPAAWWPERV